MIVTFVVNLRAHKSLELSSALITLISAGKRKTRYQSVADVSAGLDRNREPIDVRGVFGWLVGIDKFEMLIRAVHMLDQ